MSRISGRFHTDTMTRWRVSAGSDPYSPAWSKPETFACTYVDGGQLTRDDDGNQFQPSTTFWIYSGDVVKGDRVAFGNHEDESAPIRTAETVKRITTGTPLRGAAEMAVLTG